MSFSFVYSFIKVQDRLISRIYIQIFQASLARKASQNDRQPVSQMAS